MDKKLMKIEKDCSCGFSKLVSLRVFHILTFNILLGSTYLFEEKQ